MANVQRSLENIDVENAHTKKSEVVRTEQCSHATGMSLEDEEFLANFSEEKKKSAIRKVDWRLIPMLLMLYLITYIDKTNIGEEDSGAELFTISRLILKGNAKIEGLLPSLGMTGTQYNIALSIFFIPYVLAEVPSNMILERFTHPSRYLGSIVFAWGVIMTCTGIVQNFAGLTVVRFLLGLFEAGFFPGAVLLISKWYLPNETQTRIALMYSSAASGGAFSGLLAFGLAKMDGIGGVEGWRWIFIIEGILTVATAVTCFFSLIDSPALSSRWLDPDEIRYLELRQYARRIHSVQASDKKKTVDWSTLWAVLVDWKIYLLIVANWSNVVPNYALKFTMPQIIKNMGYTSATAQLLTIPPYAVGALAAYVSSVFADRYSWRMPFIVGPQLCLVVAFSILFTKSEHIKDNIAVCYFAVCLACSGMYPILPGLNAWNISNLAGPEKRSIGIGWLICAGNVGGVIGSYIYIDDEAPKYPTGFGTSFGFAAAGIVACFALEFALWTINKKNSRHTEEQIRAQYSDEELEKMGDKSPLFRYTL